ncbi:MAG: sensor histidine kinase [Archangium sp.]
MARLDPPAHLAGRSRQKTLLTFSLVNLGLYALDVLVLGRFSALTLSIRVAWGLGLLASSRYMGEEAPPSRRRALLSFQGALAGACTTGLVACTGGMQSPYMAFLPTVPLATAVSEPQDPAPAILSALLAIAGEMFMVLRSHQPTSQAVVWAGMTAVGAFFGIYGSKQFRKAEAAEQQARLERTRREALEKLAVTEHHRMQSEKLATIGRLAANVMHEINNPLAFVRSNLDQLQRAVLARPLEAEEREELTEIFEETRSGVERIWQIAADLKGFSRMDTEEPSECALADVVTDAARLAVLRLKHVARLVVNMPEELPLVLATPRRLTQVLLNLLVNAGDALEAARVTKGEVRVTGRREGARIVLLVEDNGPGFPPDVLPRLFEAFFTTKNAEKGTGLGLSISRELVEHFGGSLTAGNRAEGGALLRLELPTREPSGSPAHPSIS